MIETAVNQSQIVSDLCSPPPQRRIVQESRLTHTDLLRQIVVMGSTGFTAVLNGARSVNSTFKTSLSCISLFITVLRQGTKNHFHLQAATACTITNTHTRYISKHHAALFLNHLCGCSQSHSTSARIICHIFNLPTTLDDQRKICEQCRLFQSTQKCT